MGLYLCLGNQTWLGNPRCFWESHRTEWIAMGALKEQDAAHEPECSHVEHLCETSYLNSLVHFAPVTACYRTSAL